MSDWSIPGSMGRGIIGTTHEPGDHGGLHVLLAHGFKGYKDYGFIPWLAETIAQSGHVTHRFNFSHGGMGHGHGSFDEAAFQEDTWNRQVDDIMTLLASVQEGVLPGGKASSILLAGHSRGGATCLLAGGRHAGEEVLASLCGIVTLAAPSACLRMSEEDQDRLLVEGRLPSPSSRTEQVLHVGASWLSEQLDDPGGHDLLSLAGRIPVPVHVIHGMLDDAVPVEDAGEIADATGRAGEAILIEGSNHVFNTPNPFSPEQPPSPALQELGDVLIGIAGRR